MQDCIAFANILEISKLLRQQIKTRILNNKNQPKIIKRIFYTSQLMWSNKENLKQNQISFVTFNS